MKPRQPGPRVWHIRAYSVVYPAVYDFCFQLKSVDSNIGVKQLEKAVLGMWHREEVEKVGIRILNRKVYYPFLCFAGPLMATNCNQ